MTTEQKEIIKKSIKHYGLAYQSTVAMEECAELIQAISKVKRYGINEMSKNDLTEEMADVIICLELLKNMYGVTDEEIEKWLDFKTKRCKERME